MKKLSLLGLLLGISYHCHAQVITIKDQETGKPLELVTLSSTALQAFATTDARGQAELSAFQGADTIEIRTLGYEPISRSYAELQAASFELMLEPYPIDMRAVVVSATRWNQSASDVPSKIISITADEVALQNPQTAADLLGISGKVFIQKSQQGGGSPMIRGFATNRLLYSIDGVRMNTAIFRGGNLQNVISLDPFATEHTEVVFGPGSVIYGSDAIGGVMSFQTLAPRLTASDSLRIRGKAVARYASANEEKTGHFDINLGWKKWALVSSISTNDYGALRMGGNGPEEYLKPFYVRRQDGRDVVITNEDPRLQIPTAYSQINMMQKLRFRPGGRWDFQYGFHYSKTSDYGRYDRHLRSREGLPRYAEWDYGPQKWMMNHLNISHNSNSSLFDQMTIRLAQQSFGESRISRNFNQPRREIRIEEVDAYSVNLDFVKKAGSENTLYYGLEAIRNQVTSTGINEDIVTGVQEAGGRYPQASWSSYALYVSGQSKLARQLTVQAGLRYNRFLIDAEFDTTFYPFPFTEARLDDGALTGSLGFVYRPNESWAISANAATAFRAPNVDDVGKVFDSEPGSVVVPNPNLRAEYAYSADLGIARAFGRKVKIDLTVYYTYLRNALVRRDFSLNGADSILYDGELSQVQAIQNAALARVYGLQAGMEINLAGGFKFSSDFNFQRGEEELDEGSTSPSRHAAPWFGVSRLAYEANGLQLQASAVYSGERKFEDMPEEEKGKPEIYATDDNGNPYAPGWYSLNFRARYQFTEQLAVSAGLENLTDQRYRPYSSGLVAPGRNFVLSAQMQW